MSLNVQAISKKFDQFTAVEPLSFTIQPGEIVGFLGPNGAGKSTTLKMIAGCLSPDTGSIQLSGIDLQKDEVAYKKMIGYLPESNPLYEDLFVMEYLSFIVKAHAIAAPSKRIQEVIAQTGLQSMQHKKIGHLSKGFKQRVGIAAAIIHQPALILLDEPTSGLDPNQLTEIRNLIQQLSKDAIVLFSTHILQEVTAICSSVIVLHQSKLVANTSIDQLRKPTEPSVRVVFEEEITPHLSDPFFQKLSYEQVDKRALVIKSSDEQGVKKSILNFALDKGLNIQSLHTQEASLEEIFKLLTH